MDIDSPCIAIGQHSHHLAGCQGYLSSFHLQWRWNTNLDSDINLEWWWTELIWWAFIAHHIISNISNIDSHRESDPAARFPFQPNSRPSNSFCLRDRLGWFVWPFLNHGSSAFSDWRYICHFVHMRLDWNSQLFSPLFDFLSSPPWKKNLGPSFPATGQLFPYWTFAAKA